MDAVTEALNHMLKLQDEDKALEEAIEAEYAEILKSREQTIEAMRAWVDQLDPDEAAQKLAEFLAHKANDIAASFEVPEWDKDLDWELRRYAGNSKLSALTSAARSNILRRRELAEQDGAREPIE